MATYLDLCQMVSRESGTIDGVLPLTVSGQTGRLLKIVNWVAIAWTQIQNSRNAWRFMRKEFQGDTVAGTARYTAASLGITDWAAWITDSPENEGRAIYLYLKATGTADDGPLRQISWPQYITLYGRGAQTTNRPTEYAISPAGELCLGPVPNDVFTLRGEYMRTAQVLSLDGSIPICPAQYHDIIAWRALMLLAEFDEAGFADVGAGGKYSALLWDLERDQLPPITIGAGPLA